MRLFWILCLAMAVVCCAVQFNSANGQKDDKTATGQVTAGQLKELKMKGELQTIKSVDAKDLSKENVKQVYTVYIINRSSAWTIIAVKAGATGWITLPQPIGQTCNSGDCQSCMDAGKFLPINATDCNTAPYDLYVMVRNSQGGLAQAGPARVNPSCDFKGEVVCFNPPQ